MAENGKETTMLEVSPMTMQQIVTTIGNLPGVTGNAFVAIEGILRNNIKPRKPDATPAD